jgi:hypothetical protein
LRFLVFCCLVGCSRVDPAVPPALDAAPASGPSLDLTAAWLDGGFSPAPPRPLGQVVLDEPGREPRAVLRYAPVAHDRRQYKLTVTTRQSLRISDSPDTPMAGGDHVIWLTTTAPEAGAGTWGWELGRIEVPPGPRQRVDESFFAEWKPSRGELTVDARGRRSVDERPLFAWRASGPNEMLKLHDDMIDVLVPVLPEEPVGVGARWQQRDQLVRGGITVSRTTAFELRGTPGKPRLRAQVTLVGGPQRISATITGELVEIDLASWKVEAESEYAWDGKSLLPDAAELAYHLDFVVIDPRHLGRGESSDLIHSRVEISASLAR